MGVVKAPVCNLMQLISQDSPPCMKLAGLFSAESLMSLALTTTYEMVFTEESLDLGTNFHPHTPLAFSNTAAGTQELVDY
jgi:hypothetical protein